MGRSARGRVRRWSPLAAVVLAAAGTAGGWALAGPAWASGSLTASFAKSSDWGTGYVADFTLANGGPAVRGWTLSFDLAPGQSMTNSWDGVVSRSGDHYVVTNATWNATVATGGSAQFGYQATYSGTFVAPTHCLINGAPCGGTSNPPPPTTTTTTAPPPTTTTTTAPPPTTTTTTAPPRHTGGGAGLSARFTKTSDWGDGYVGNYTIADAGAPITSWTLTFTLPSNETVTGYWSGTVSHQGTHYTVVNAAWNGSVGTNGTATVGFQGNYTGSFVAPQHCTVNGVPCGTGSATGGSGGGSGDGTGGSGGGSGTTSGTGTGTGTTPLPPLPAGTAFPFAPYVDATVDTPPFNLAAADTASGTHYFSLGFVVSGGGCQASWGGYYPVSSGYYRSGINALRAAGGDVIVSFGGEAGVSLLDACTTVASLEAQYQAVVTEYGLSHIDFDIEGADQGNTAALARNFKAMALLEAANPNLSVSLTLPVLPTGLTPLGLGVVKAATANGARVDLVNVMAMDFGAGAAPNPAGNMGGYAIDAALATHTQLQALYPALSSAQVWGMVGVTPMLGVNDTTSEVFTLAAAQQLATFAAEVQMGRLSMWAATRDVACPGGAGGYASDTCSGIAQQPFAFSKVFAASTG